MRTFTKFDFGACSIFYLDWTILMTNLHSRYIAGLENGRIVVQFHARLRKGNSLPPKRSDCLCSPPIFLFNEYRSFSPGIKRPGSEARHSCPPNAEVKKSGAHGDMPSWSTKKDLFLDFPWSGQHKEFYTTSIYNQCCTCILSTNTTFYV
jgi:hypothetical protein